MSSLSVPDFTNPHEFKIIELEQLYWQRLGENRCFEELKQIKIAIKNLKSEISVKGELSSLDNNTINSPANK